MRQFFFKNVFFHAWLLPVYPAIVLVYLYREVFVIRDSIFTHDSIHWYPNFNHFVVSLAHGHLPLWDPYSFSGAPFYLNHNIVGALDPTLLVSVPLVWFGVSVLDIYHLHFLVCLLILYAGAYALFRFVSKNDFGAMIGAVIVLFVMAPNSFWQHGSTVMLTYVPLIMLFLLKLVLPEVPQKPKGVFFIAACYLIGLSFNLYFPSYLFIYLSLALLYLLIARIVRMRDLWTAIVGIGARAGMAGVVVFFIMGGVFLCSLKELIQPIGENFSLTRFADDTQSSVLAHAIPLFVTEAASASRSSTHNLMGGFLPGPDVRFFLRESNGMSEAVIFFGLAPLMLGLIFFKSDPSPYEGLFLFLMVVIGAYLFSPEPFFKGLLLHYPAARSIRQISNFVGFFMLSWGALTAICFANVYDRVTGKISSPMPSPLWTVFLAMAHVSGLFAYLASTYHQMVSRDLSLEFIYEAKWLIFSYGWLFLISYLLVAWMLWVRATAIKKMLFFILWGLLFYQLVELNVQLKPNVIQPGLGIRTGDIHYDREFVYNPIRVPFVPRHSLFWGYLPALYRVPSAIPPYFNDYMSLSRRTYDFIRFTSAERQRIISGIGVRRFGFFDKYTVASDSVDALNLVDRMPLERLHDTLVLEGNPSQIVPELQGLEHVDAGRLPREATLVRGIDQRLVEFYDRASLVSYKESSSTKLKQFLHLEIPKKHPALDWPWDEKHIGYFQVMFGAFRTSDNYRVFRYYPNPGIRVGYQDDLICYTEMQEWLTKHRYPKFYDTIYKQAPYSCDLERVGDELVVSPELQGAYVTADPSGPEVDRPIPGFGVVSLDPERITPERSPYGRDEPTEVTEFGPNSVSFKIHNGKPGLFYYADSYSENWRVKVDGKPAHLFRADFNYKAVFVPVGEHQVQMEFKPALYSVLMWCFIVFSIPGMALPVMGLYLCDSGREND